MSRSISLPDSSVRPVVGDPESMAEAIAEAGYPARLADITL